MGEIEQLSEGHPLDYLVDDNQEIIPTQFVIHPAGYFFGSSGGKEKVWIKPTWLTIKLRWLIYGDKFVSLKVR